MAVYPSKAPLGRITTAAALLFLTAAGVHGQASANWCATTLDLPEGPPPPRSVFDYQMVEAPAASETVVIGVLFLYTQGLTESAVRRKSVEWIRTANQLLNAGTTRYRIVLKRAGVRRAPENVNRASNKSEALYAVTGAHPGLIPVRRELGADIVSVVLPGNVGGIAWL